MIDKENRAVPKEDAQHMADEMSLQYMEVSAQEGTGVCDAFMKLIRDILTPKEEESGDESEIHLNSESSKAQGFRCY